MKTKILGAMLVVWLIAMSYAVATCYSGLGDAYDCSSETCSITPDPGYLCEFQFVSDFYGSYTDTVASGKGFTHESCFNLFHCTNELGYHQTKLCNVEPGTEGVGLSYSECQ
jgi:hypothetical protein